MPPRTKRGAKLIVQQIVNGISIGFVYAIVAVGYSLIFGVLRIMNMAYASIFTVGAHFILMFITAKWGMVPAVIATMALTGLVSVFFDFAMLAPLRSKPGGTGTTVLITAIGFNYVLQNLCMVIWGSERKSFPNVIDFGTIRIAGFNFDSTQFVITGVSIILLIILSWIIYGTNTGLGMRAVQQNTKAANLMGVNVKRTITFTFFLSGITAVIAAFLVSSYYQLVYPTMGVQLGSKAFASAVLGGIGILHGSVLGGLIVGILECLSVYFFGGGYREAVAFIILLGVLLVKPTGLFGKKANTKV